MALYADAYLKKISNGFEYLNTWCQIGLLLMIIVLGKQKIEGMSLLIIH